MLRYRLVLLLLLVLSYPRGGQAQTSMDGGARAAALGGAATALRHEVWGHANPASWATLTGRAVAFFATEAFGLSALRLAAAAYAEPTRLGTFAGGVRTFGFDAYRETHLVAGYAHGFGLGSTRRCYVGLRLDYHRVSIPDYGTAGALGIAVGGLVSVLPALDVGFEATNVHVPKLAGREALPRVLSLGLAYAPDEALLVVVDAYKDVRFPLSVRAGLEARPVAALVLRAGAATKPARFTAGIGLRLGLLRADVAGELHEALGWSPAVAFGVQW